MAVNNELVPARVVCSLPGDMQNNRLRGDVKRPGIKKRDILIDIANFPAIAQRKIVAIVVSTNIQCSDYDASCASTTRRIAVRS